MADIKISQLEAATTVSDTDIVVINQGNITKTATRSLIRGTQNAGTVTSITAGTGLTGGTITDSGTIGLAAITSVALTTGTITTAPSNANDIANKAYADSIGSGINFHDAADYATTAALSAAYTYANGTSGVGATITANANGTLTIDGYTFIAGDVGKRILIKNEPNAFVNNTTPSAAFNGVYTLTTAGTASARYVLTRATDYDTSGTGPNEVQAGDFILVLNGTLANTAWVQQTQGTIIFGSSNIVFTQFAAAASGVTTFSTGTTGLTVNQATGQVILSGGQLAIANGGTGTTAGIANINTTQIAALTTAQTANLIPQLTTSGLLSLTQIPTLPVANGGTGTSSLTGIVKGTGTTAMVAADSGTDYVAGADVSSYRVTAVLDTSLSLSGATKTETKITFASGVQTDIDSHVLAAGDIIFLAASITSPNSSAYKGPWVITTAGAIGTAAVWDRPNWWTTGTARSGVLFSVTKGSIYQGSVWSIYPTNANDAGINVGFTGLTAINVSLKAGLPVASGGTGVVTLTSGSLLKGNGTSAISSATAGTDYVVPSGNITGTAAGLSTTLAIASGGTGATNAANAKVNLEVQLKESCKYATVAALPANTATANILTGTSPGALSVDGVAVALNDRILVKDEATLANNGIYDVTATGGVGAAFVLTRSTDSNQAFEIKVDDIVPITLGAQLANTFWLQKSTVTGIGTSPITFVSSTLGGILPITKGGTGAIDAPTARANLGITGGTPTDVQVFTSSNNWNKLAGAVYVDIVVIGAGGGGASGRKGGTTNAAGGGGGGAGGSYTARSFQASLLAATESITVGTGGTGGAAVTGTNVNGNAGTAGGNSSFGSWATVSGGGAAGAATTAGGTAGSAASARAMFQASSGAAGALGAGASALSATVAAGGGGAAGGLPISATVGFAGGNGGTCLSTWFSGGNGSGGAIGLLGSDGQSVTAGSALCSGGGGGGGSAFTGNGGNGGNGGIYGGGGGGGGAALDGVSSSGKGGDGANGIVIVTTYF